MIEQNGMTSKERLDKQFHLGLEKLTSHRNRFAKVCNLDNFRTSSEEEIEGWISPSLCNPNINCL